RRIAPGRLMRGALRPAPQQRGGADQRDYSRKNAREIHQVLLLIASVLSDVIWVLDRTVDQPPTRRDPGSVGLPSHTVNSDLRHRRLLRIIRSSAGFPPARSPFSLARRR